MTDYRLTNKKVYSHKINMPVLEAIPLGIGTLLDLGCGKGENGKEISKRNVVVDAVTISIEEASQVKSIYRQVYLYNLEDGLPELPNRYDCILCSHLLEHIAYPNRLLAAIHNQLQDEGTLIVALPNLLNYKSRLQLLLGNFEYESQGTWDYTHLRWYTFSSGKKLLKESGFAIEKFWVGGDLPFLTFTKGIPVKLRRKIFKYFTFLSPGLFGNQLIYVAKKKK